MEKKLLGQKEIITQCLNNSRQAQFRLYEKYSPGMFGICLRYAKNSTDAEDILQEGFIKVFRYLKDYSGKGSFEGWMRRIMINSALNFYKRKNLISKGIDPEDAQHYLAINYDHDALSKMNHEELLKLVHDLPDGYRTVFNLNIIEGYSHKEIGDMMKISVNTSKSQLSRARTSLKRRVMNLMQSEEVKIKWVAQASF
jgi:RNA polymerase sigma-70 factor (ECF subfamily)